MGDENNRKNIDWQKVDALVKVAKGDFVPGVDAQKAIKDTRDAILNIGQNREEGIIERFKKQRIAAKGAVKEIELIYKERLQYIEEALKQVSRVKKYEIEKTADQYLEEIDSIHIENLMKLGLRNVKARTEVMVALHDETAKLLKTISEKDWPQSLIDQMIHKAMQQHEKFLEKITETP